MPHIADLPLQDKAWRDRAAASPHKPPKQEFIVRRVGAGLPGIQWSMPMRKSDAFPTRFFKAKDFPYEPQIFTVESVRVEEIKHNDKTQSKYVVYFAGVKSGLVLGPTVWEEICKATGEEDSDNWRGRSIELFRTETIFGGKTVDCIRVRPLSGQLPLKKSKPKPAAPPPAQSGGGGDMDDSIPFAAEWRT